MLGVGRKQRRDNHNQTTKEALLNCVSDKDWVVGVLSEMHDATPYATRLGSGGNCSMLNVSVLLHFEPLEQGYGIRRGKSVEQGGCLLLPRRAIQW